MVAVPEKKEISKIEKSRGVS